MKKKRQERWSGPHDALPALRRWIASVGYSPFPFQEAVWNAQSEGKSGLLHMPTGAGKTYAAYVGALAEVAELRAAGAALATRLLYVTPLRALSRDIEKALRRPVEGLQWPVVVGSRTGDTSTYARAKLQATPPDVLVTTPESLALMISYGDAEERFLHLRTVIVDEWHELLGTKRGSLLELTLSRLRALAPSMKTWALSATLSNVAEAARAASGVGREPVVVTHPMERKTVIDTLLPREVDRFPWAGHMGMKMLPPFLAELDPNIATLVFANTRFQAERWHQALNDILGETDAWKGRLAIHHGSLDRNERERVENGIKDGELRLVVCTSSLDLGVDLCAVERVFQVGSPKALGRVVQRAGRSGHRPGARARITFVPTHALELLEIAACRGALAAGVMEPRTPLGKPLDVLAQHLVTTALGGGFDEDELFREARTAASFERLTEQEFQWTLALVTRGGNTLGAYPQFRRVRPDDRGRYREADATIARRHRMNIGTIVSDTTVSIQFPRGPKLGAMEESYLTRLRPGDRFVFGGRLLELIRIRDLVAHVRLAKGGNFAIPQWPGGKMPLSPSLSEAVRQTLAQVKEKTPAVPELATLEPIFEAQRRLSAIPAADETLLEIWHERDGSHLFLYPFEGRAVHEGLAAVLAFRLSRLRKATFSVSANDYGFELFAAGDFDFETALGAPGLFATDTLADDVLASLNLSELARRQFREIARIAGLTLQNHPGERKSARHLQASSGLLYDVLDRYEPNSLLLAQARREVLEGQFEQTRLVRVLERLAEGPWIVRTLDGPTPLAFPLVVARIGARLSTETLVERIDRLKKGYEAPRPKKRARR